VQVVPLVCQALHFEQRRGAFSVGSHVRDAAAYVCWSFARAYQPAAILDSFQVLAPALLCTACYDREVTCRRSAAAAFQESVGRLGAQNFPEGMDIIASADYFSLGSRRQSFLTVAPSIARVPQYHVPLFEHLCNIKVCCWDIRVRELAAEGLSALVPLNLEFAAEHVFNVLIPQCNSAESMEVQHGSILAVAAMLPVLSSSAFIVDEQQKAAVIATAVHVGQGKGPQRIGKNADVISITICNLIATISSLQYSLDEPKVC
jgi:tubulin-specific chaperone D